MGYLEIKDRIESDHPPVIAWMRKGERRRRKEKVDKEVKRKFLEPG